MTNGRRRGSQNNITDEFQANLPADVTVCNKYKMAAIDTLCIIRYMVFIVIMRK